MVGFSGYSKRPEPKWPYALLAILALVLLCVVVFYKEPKKDNNTKILPKKEKAAVKSIAEKNKDKLSPPKKEEKKEAKSIAGITIDRMVITPGINLTDLLMDLSEFSKKQGGKVYCFTKVSAVDIPNAIRHVWIDPNGRAVVDTKIDITNSPANVWSYINASGKKSGEWQIIVKTLDGDILSKHSLRITD